MVLCRLRIGHARLGHGYLMNRDSQPTCISCRVRISVKHILSESLAYYEDRREFRIEGKRDEIFSNPQSKVNDLLVSLKLIYLYKEI